MSLFSEIERTIERGFRHWTERMFGPAQADELILIHRAMLEDVEGKVQTIARGKRVFPFAHLTVTVGSPDAARRALLASAFAGLERDVRKLLEGAGCIIPAGFSVDVRTAESGAPFMIEYGVAPPPPVEKPLAAIPRIVVVRGKAEREEYTLGKPRINIGRLPELLDPEQRLVRRNDIVFEEGADPANATVSRKHAHIRLDAGDYRICDDESEYGTRIFRDGRAVEVPPGNRRGEKLRAGDEIYLGRACLRFEEG